MGDDQGIAVERVLPQNMGVGDVDVTAQVFFLASVDEHNPTLGAFDNGSVALSHIEEADLEEREVSENGSSKGGFPFSSAKRSAAFQRPTRASRVR